MRARRLHATSLGSGAELPRSDLIAALTPAEARALLYEWTFWARPNQSPPNGEWRVWLVLAGRGFGKTRTGAEMIRARVTARTAHRLALVAPTAGDARDVMVEGESGILAICQRRRENASTGRSKTASRMDAKCPHGRAFATRQ